MQRYKEAWLASLAVMALLAAVGVTSVMLAAREDERRARVLAKGFAEGAAQSTYSAMELAVAPLLALASAITKNPDVRDLASWFYEEAPRLFNAVPKRVGVYGLQVSPQGVVAVVYPLEQNMAALGRDAFNYTGRIESAQRTVRRRELTMQGPVLTVSDRMGLLFRLPIFLNTTDPNELWGAPRPATNCSPCAFDGHSRFWGFATVLVDFEAQLEQPTDAPSGTRMSRLRELGYDYELVGKAPFNGSLALSSSRSRPQAPVVVPVPTPAAYEADDSWELMLAPAAGWTPAWRAPMLAVVVVGAAALGALSGVLLRNRRRLLRVVKRLKAAYSHLADEKARKDVLLVRQMNLIGCMFDGRRSGAAGGGLGSQQGALDGPREQIEDLRRTLQQASSTEAEDPGERPRLLELLGQGGFGKVYKGLWRGSVVAVKVMVMPARMSGSEKRERMAVMETAISSAMQHPNIVQTYTYTIKRSTVTSDATAVEQSSQVGAFSMGFHSPNAKGAHVPPRPAMARPTPDAAGGAAAGGAAAAAPAAAGAHAAPAGDTSSGLPVPSADTSGFEDPGGRVQNFEVCLVLEFCDQGSLRDALDAGAFKMADGSVNFAAVLDTALDIARAMLHLHKQSVIHSDLKPRNVLLKSDGSQGRGLVAKVADFGLSVTIEQHMTHVSQFQGTLSYMGPETILHSRINKASDVYAFGITLWELYTGASPFKRVPTLLLAHRVAVEGLRPELPEGAPEEFSRLVRACWAPDWKQRPSFGAVLAELEAMRRRVRGATPPLRSYTPHTGEKAHTLNAGLDSEHDGINWSSDDDTDPAELDSHPAPLPRAPATAAVPQQPVFFPADSVGGSSAAPPPHTAADGAVLEHLPI